MGEKKLVPTFAEEKGLQARGYRLIAGVDEVGRGALAGPVVAAAVILPEDLKGAWLSEVRDSKLLTPKAREALSLQIHQSAVAVGIGQCSCEIIDGRGIAKATRIAMKKAIAHLSPPPEYVLIDYFRVPEITLPQKGVADGDGLCLSIACASIVAKVFRDGLMVEADKLYPGYGFARNKGYCVDEHVAALGRLGPSPIHRRTFAPVGGLFGVDW